ncbi:hypothetical protein D1AOALGA4SA_8414 [Olavius algarvensis Delta 1 endosymbiont]|nr:hypothetical protein D1AOALGA4SA_8414 [Olavius algarvensis Delta 1 endosymbiont]
MNAISFQCQVDNRSVDSASAIWTTLPAGKAVATSELSMSFVRPMSRQIKI